MRPSTGIGGRAPHARSPHARLCWCKPRKRAWPFGPRSWARGAGAHPRGRSKTDRPPATGSAR
eukprot:6517685-Lingulodinium_polyedra.AAC.1